MRKTPALAVAIALFGAGCSSTPSTPTPAAIVTPSPARAVIRVTVAPDSIVVRPSGDKGLPWRLDYNVTVSETAGLPCNVNRIVRSYRHSAGGPELDNGVWSPPDLIRAVGTNFVDAHGSLDASFSFMYRGSKHCVLTVTVEAIDAHGHVVTATTGRLSIDERGAIALVE